jgi:hypothetical protein
MAAHCPGGGQGGQREIELFAARIGKALSRGIGAVANSPGALANNATTAARNPMAIQAIDGKHEAHGSGEKTMKPSQASTSMRR